MKTITLTKDRVIEGKLYKEGAVLRVVENNKKTLDKTPKVSESRSTKTKKMRVKEMEEYYAIVQAGGPIYGVGKTPEEARQDATEWVDDGDLSDLEIVSKQFTGRLENV